MNVITETTTKVANKINRTKLDIENTAAMIKGTLKEYNQHKDYYKSLIK